MTEKEAAIVTAYTGILIGEFSKAHAYIEQIMGRPLWTHELVTLADEIKSRAKADFLAIQITTDAPA